MADERQARLEARARIDIKKLYEKGQITLKDRASAIGYLRGVWFDHFSDVEIEDFICREIRKLEPPTIQPVEQLLNQETNDLCICFLVSSSDAVAVRRLVPRASSWPLLLSAEPRLLHRYAIEFPRPFLVKKCAFRFVAAAPMFVTTRNE